MKEKILLVDGHSIANRAFYGIPLLTNKDGEYTNAVYGFLNILLSVIEEERPKYLAIAFDLSAPTFRHEQFKEYKGQRKRAPEEFRQQIPLLKSVLDSLNIKRYECEGYEADDILGTLAKKAEKEGLYPVILSGDRDMMQVTSDNIRLKIPKTKKGGTEVEEYYAKDIIEKYGVTPLEYIDVKGLMGDTSDNIPGVPGVGEKTALRLIKEYHSIENVIENIPNIKQKKLSENLTTYSKQALDSKILATIVTDMDIELNLQEMEYSLKLSKESMELFQKLEFKNLLNRLELEDGIEEQLVEDNHEFTKVKISTKEELDKLKKELKSVKELAYTIVEEENNIIGLGICYSDSKSYWIESCKELTNSDILEGLKEALEDPNITKIGHDVKADMHLFKENGIDIEGIGFDTLLGAYVIDPNNSTYEISEIGNIYLDEHIKTEEELLGKGKKRISILEIEEDEKTTWLCTRVNILYRASKAIELELIDHNQKDLFYDIEMPLIRVLFDMENAGIKIEQSKLKTYGDMIQEKIDVITKRIYDYAGEEFNINSPKQLGIILFEKLEIPPIKKTKTGYSTSADVLDKLKGRYPIVSEVLEYRQLSKLKSTYVDGLFSVVDKETSKIHSTFNQTITSTGRISSTEPNLQNIPIRMDLGRKVRKVFVPSNEDYVFVDADYSQIELRLLAHISDDPTFINAFISNQDIHKLTASQVFNIPFDEVTKAQRSDAKAVNFGIVYGISPFSLSEDLNITQKEAKLYIDGYFEKYPKVKEYLDNIILSAKEDGYVETLFKRRRPIPEIHSRNFNIRSFGERIAMNTPIQGSAADIIKIAMIRVDNRLKKHQMKSKLILTVHDELLVEAHVDEIDQVKEILKYEMENAVKLKVPIDVDLNVGKTWYEV